MPLVPSMPMLAEEPVKVKDTPVPGHVNSCVSGFTRPRNRTAVTLSMAASSTRGDMESFMMKFDDLKDAQLVMALRLRTNLYCATLYLVSRLTRRTVTNLVE